MCQTNKVGFLLLASLLFFSGEIISQDIATRLYTTKEDGLPQTQILNIRKAPDNSLLLCSHGGLMRYDGFSFSSITTNNGLSSNLVIDAAYFHDTLYILTADAVHLFVGDKICETIPAAEGHKLYCGILALSDQGKYIYNISDHQEGAYMNLETEELFHSFQGKTVRDHLFTITDSSFLICEKNKIFEQRFNATIKYEIFRSETPIIGISFDRGPLFIMCSGNKEDSTYVRKIYVCKRNKTIEVLDTVSGIPEEFHVHGQKLSAIYPAGEKTYFIAHADGWLYFVDNKKFYRFPENYNNIHGVVFDEDGNAWAGTEKGLLKIFTKGFRYIFPERGFPDNIWAAAGIGANEILLAGYESGLYLYSGTGQKIHEWPSHAGLYYYNTICQGFGDELIISTCPGITRFNTKTKTRQLFKEKMPQTSLTVFKDELDNRILVGHMYALVSIDDHYNVDTLLVTKDLGANSTILSIERIDDIIYLGLSKGLISYDVNTGESKLLINEKIRINDLAADSNGILWGATNAGLVSIEHDGKYKPIEGIPISESVLTLEVLPNDILFEAPYPELKGISLSDIQSIADKPAAQQPSREVTADRYPVQQDRGTTTGYPEFQRAYDSLTLLIPPDKYSYGPSGYYRQRSYWSRETEWVETDPGLLGRFWQSAKSITGTTQDDETKDYRPVAMYLRSFFPVISEFPEDKRFNLFIYLTLLNRYNLEQTSALFKGIGNIVPLVGTTDANAYYKVIRFLGNNPNDGPDFLKMADTVIGKFPKNCRSQILETLMENYRIYFNNNLSFQKELTANFLPMVSRIDTAKLVRYLQVFYELSFSQNQERAQQIAMIDMEYTEDLLAAQAEKEAKEMKKSQMKKQSAMGIGTAIGTIALIALFLVLFSIQGYLKKIEQGLQKQDQ